MKRSSKVQTCPLVILYSISAKSPSKQQGGRHIVIGAMGSVDRVITLGGGGGGWKPETGIIKCIYVESFVRSETCVRESANVPEKMLLAEQLMFVYIMIRLREVSACAKIETWEGEHGLEFSSRQIFK